MAKVISQETFNGAVKENIDDLGMAPDEALEDAVKQFEAQGVDLSNIAKELMTEAVAASLIDPNALVKNLKTLNNSKVPPEQILEKLKEIKKECDTGLQNKVALGKAGAYNVLLEIYNTNSHNYKICVESLKTLISLITKNPDLLDQKGVDMIVQGVQNSDALIKSLILKFAKECCIMHENNRQKIFDTNIVETIKQMLNNVTGEQIKDVLALARALVLDDDIRVEFGKAHEHARVIASETLCSLTELLTRFKTDEKLIHDLLLTISVLMVRSEFCKKVDDAGGLDVITEVMKLYTTNDKICKQCFKLLKALTGDDGCKARIIKVGLGPLISDGLFANKDKVKTAVAGLSCIAGLALRSSENSAAMFTMRIPEVIVSVMRQHPDNIQIQKTASWAIRNMVSRNKEKSDNFLQQGVEEILKKNLTQFKAIEYDTKAALRDLGCTVQLKEEWTGKGGALNIKK